MLCYVMFCVISLGAMVVRRIRPLLKLVVMCIVLLEQSAGETLQSGIRVIFLGRLGKTCNSKSKPIASRYSPLWIFPFELPLKVLKLRLLGRRFHILIRNVSFASPTDVEFHNPHPWGAGISPGV